MPEPQVVYEVSDFKGLVTAADPKDLAPGASPSLENVTLDRPGMLRSRRGLIKVGADEAASGTILSICVPDFGIGPSLVWNSTEKVEDPPSANVQTDDEIDAGRPDATTTTTTTSTTTGTTTTSTTGSTTTSTTGTTSTTSSSSTTTTTEGAWEPCCYACWCQDRDMFLDPDNPPTTLYVGCQTQTEVQCVGQLGCQYEWDGVKWRTGQECYDAGCGIWKGGGREMAKYDYVTDDCVVVTTTTTTTTTTTSGTTTTSSGAWDPCCLMCACIWRHYFPDPENPPATIDGMCWPPCPPFPAECHYAWDEHKWWTRGECYAASCLIEGTPDLEPDEYAKYLYAGDDCGATTTTTTTIGG